MQLTLDPKKNSKSKKEDLINSFFNMLSTNKRYFFIAAIEATLFFIYYYIVSPSNFSSFSNTLRYFISALGTLLAVVVSFNTLVLQSQLKNMPTNMDNLNKQLDNVENIVRPVLKMTKEEDFRQAYDKILEDATLYFTNAIESMIIVAKNHAQEVVRNSNNNNDGKENNELRKLSDGFIKEAEYRLSLYNKYKSPYNLITISTTYFVQKMRFASGTYANEKTHKLYETIKHLHVLRSICQRIYIRDTVATLSYELLISTIPIITFIAAISSISNYEQYNILLLRILFAISLSAAALPFILLLVRNLPILHLVKSSSTIPFARKK
jgi:hypothetical protein